MKYILKNTRVKTWLKNHKYFKGYEGNRPTWTNRPSEAARYELELAVKIKRRLFCQSQFVMLVRFEERP